MANFLALGDIVQLNKDDDGRTWMLRAEVIHLPNGPGEPWGFRDLDRDLEVYTLEKWTAYKRPATQPERDGRGSDG